MIRFSIADFSESWNGPRKMNYPRGVQFHVLNGTGIRHQNEVQAWSETERIPSGNQTSWMGSHIINNIYIYIHYIIIIIIMMMIIIILLIIMIIIIMLIIMTIIIILIIMIYIYIYTILTFFVGGHRLKSPEVHRGKSVEPGL